MNIRFKDIISAGNRKQIIAWALYDWANSGYATTVMSGFFPIFFNQFWCIGVDQTVSTARLGFANSAAGLVIFLSASLLGAIADQGSSVKKFLLFFTGMSVILTIGLFFIAYGHWFAAVVLYTGSAIGFSGSNIFYDALIKGVAEEKQLDYVSSLGYSLGYLGGGILFAINILMVFSPGTFGLHSMNDAYKYSFITVGLWWGIFAIPLFLFVKEPIRFAGTLNKNLISAGFLQLRGTFKEIRYLKTIMLFLAAYWFYIDGVDTIIRMAIDYGIKLKFDSQSLVTALLITQFIGFPAAIGFGYISNLIGTKRALFISLAVYIGISIWGTFIHHIYEFYLIAIIIGLVQGGIQALSRSFYARIIPANKAAEYFGFYNMLGKFAIVIGPALMGGVVLVIKSLGFSSDTASRGSVFSVAILFILGGLILFLVDEKKGKDEMKYLQ
jgi:UMF1 family MFS transporter